MAGGIVQTYCEGNTIGAGDLFADGHVYEHQMGRWSQRVGDVFLEWLDVSTNRDWLDAGCGNGAFTERIVRKCAPSKVNAVDPSEAQLSFARRRITDARVEFLLADAQRLPFPDRSFDAGVMALVINFIPDPSAAVAELARVIRSDGWSGAYMWYGKEMRHPMQPMYEALISMGLTPPTVPSPEASSRDSMRSRWEGAGFTAVETRIINVQVEFRDFEDYWKSNFVPVGPMGFIISKLSAEQEKELRSRVREQLRQGADQRIAYDVFANAVKGRAA